MRTARIVIGFVQLYLSIVALSNALCYANKPIWLQIVAGFVIGHFIGKSLILIFREG